MINEECLFGEIAISCKYITRDQLSECLALQERYGREGKRKRIGDCLIEAGYLSEGQRQWALKVQDYSRQRGEDLLYGKLLVEKGFASKGNVEKALGMQESAFKQKHRVCKLREIMVQQGYITEQKAGEIQQCSEAPKEEMGIKPKNVLDPLLGERLGPYQIVEKVGNEKVGAVYVARDSESDRTVEIQVFSKEKLGRIKQIQRFLRGMQIASRIKHPNAIAIHKVVEKEGCIFVVTDPVVGEPLEEKLKRDGKLDANEAILMEGCRRMDEAEYSLATED